MTPSVADKAPIPAKVWRRHSDPPSLWISVVIGSVFLHLLAFLLMRSSNAFNLWFPQQSQAAVPIELIDIAPKTKSITKSKSTAKTVSPKPVSSTQKSVQAPSRETSRTTPKNQDFGAINSADSFPRKKRISSSQSNSKPLRLQKVSPPTPKPIFTPKPVATPKPIATPKPVATPKPTIPVGNLPWKHRQEIKFGKGTALPTGVPSQSPVKETPPIRSVGTLPTSAREIPHTPTPQTRPTSTRETQPTSTPETRSTPTRETQPTPTPETSPTSTQGGALAVVAPLVRDEMINLIKTKQVTQDIPPDVIASYTGSNTKQLDLSFLPGDSDIKPAQILASLEVDRNGKFQQARVLEIEPATLQSEKSKYEEVLNEVFKTENFIAAHNNDGTKPDLSNFFVRIRIQSANSK